MEPFHHAGMSAPMAPIDPLRDAEICMSFEATIAPPELQPPPEAQRRPSLDMESALSSFSGAPPASDPSTLSGLVPQAIGTVAPAYDAAHAHLKIDPSAPDKKGGGKWTPEVNAPGHTCAPPGRFS